MQFIKEYYSCNDSRTNFRKLYLVQKYELNKYSLEHEIPILDKIQEKKKYPRPVYL